MQTAVHNLLQMDLEKLKENFLPQFILQHQIIIHNLFSS